MRRILSLSLALSLSLLLGCEGPEGAAGPAGANGAPGADGLPGEPGEDGTDGAPGTPGADGQNGTDGVDGAPGADGEDGTDGVDGTDGTDGVDGEDGAPGADGEDGQDGAPGADGEDGLDGQNAYITGPGVKVTVTDVTIADGKAVATFTVTDEAGTPLDRSGRYTVGAVSVSFILAYLDGAYVAYTTRSVTTPANSPNPGVTVLQAAADSGGTYAKIGEGEYTYTLKAPVVPADATKTHTLGVYATRTFEGVRYVANTEFDFRPDGAPVSEGRTIVTQAACESCHNGLEAHGGARRDVKLCLLCHTTQTPDPDSGHTTDFPVMIHKIHSGEHLPSVQAGTPYAIIGHQQSVADYSTVVFPTAVNRCVTCHTGTQGDVWKTKATVSACASCHDLTSFEETVPAGMVQHSNGPYANDEDCMTCHRQGNAGTEKVHMLGLLSATAPKLSAKIFGVTNTAPGETPVMTFMVIENGLARDLLAKPLTSLRVTVAGPTTDYAGYYQHTIQASSNAVGVLAPGTDAGTFTYTFPAPMAAAATGSFAMALEGYDNLTYTNNAGASTTARNAIDNPIVYVAVTDEVPVPAAEAIETAKCEACHTRLGAHGGQRVTPQYCALCHIPSNTNLDRVAKVEGETVAVESTHFPVMIHKIHMGEELSQEYVLGGNPAPSAADPDGNPLLFSEVRFPGSVTKCETCHKAGSYGLPLPAGRVATLLETRECQEDPGADADSFCNAATDFVQVAMTELPPIAARCNACHDGAGTAVHAQLMTTADGQESCVTCHGPGRSEDVEAVHAGLAE